jgi:hypothetical protein
MSKQHHLVRLVEWYAAYRDDEWEHRHGFKLEPLEHRPGWQLVVDTTGTELADVVTTAESVVRSDTDWLQWVFEPGSFRASGGERNVGDMVDRFFEEFERLGEVYRRG